MKPVPLSVLDLSPILLNGTARDALLRTQDLAKHVEKLGYNRYWLAEHHSMPGIASAATSIAMSYVADHTSTIRVGSGGIMLSNHAPLMIAEQFGTLEALYPGRIDLGLGRAPGSDQPTSRALRRGLNNTGEEFPEQLAELRGYLSPLSKNNAVRAIPGEGMKIPIWLLGSSTFSAQLAGYLGLPFAFAGQFSPAYMLPALQLYRQRFQPSENMEAPYAMVGVNVFAAESEREAQRLFTSQQQMHLDLVRGVPGQLAPPVESMDGLWQPNEKASVESMLNSTIVGDRAQVKAQLQALVETTHADEIIIHSMIYDHAARMRSYDIVANEWRS
jgi:luciferase family oxidoreductase group 1